MTKQELLDKIAVLGKQALNSSHYHEAIILTALTGAIHGGQTEGLSNVVANHVREVMIPEIKLKELEQNN